MNTQTEIKKIVELEIYKVIDKAQRLFPKFKQFAYPEIFFYTSATNRALGLAYGHYRIGINIDVAMQFTNNTLNDTVPHEVAHIVCSATGMGHGHDAGWRRVASLLGAIPRAKCTDRNITVPKLRKRVQYQYNTPKLGAFWVSDVCHKKVQTGTVRILQATKERIERHHFTGMTR